MRRWLSAVAVALALTVAPDAASAATLVPIAPPAAWISAPIHATSPPADQRLFVVGRGGTVQIVKDGALAAAPFLTIPNVDTLGERGLLSIAFAPDYKTSGLFYAFYVAAGPDALDPSGAAGDVRVVEYRRSASDPDLADPASVRLVLKQPHAGASNHNGGQLAFGPDSYLYITIGDAAVGANSQDLGNDLGKVLRIDPDDPDGAGSATFGIPPSNPFLATAGARGEIYALGLRNPYRASFAPDGSLVVADVGAGTWEEVEAGNLAGKNFGWPICEGVCPTPHPELTDPVFQYPHGADPAGATGCAIIGGYVVRDPALTSLHGRYLYGDLCRPDLRSLNLTAPGTDPRPTGLVLPNPETASLLSFGEDSGGHAYAITSETVYRVEADASERVIAGDDTTSPRPLGLTLRATDQRLRGHLEVVATCSENCVLQAGGLLRLGARPTNKTAPKLRPDSGPGAAGAPVQLRLELRPKLRRRASRALKAGRGVAATVTVSAADAAGSLTRQKVQVKLLPPKRGQRLGAAT